MIHLIEPEDYNWLMIAHTLAEKQMARVNAVPHSASSSSAICLFLWDNKTPVPVLQTPLQQQQVGKKCENYCRQITTESGYVSWPRGGGSLEVVRDI